MSYQQNENAQFASASAINVEQLTAGDDSVDAGDRTTQTQTNEQGSEAVVEQFQNVSQVNINSQTAAVAVAVDDSCARAIQSNFQSNYNIQYGEASAANKESVHTSIDDGNETAAFDYAGPNADQDARAAVLQSQYVRQLNINEQNSAIAVAEHGGTAVAVQRNFQRNVNQQIGTANATNGQQTDCGCSDGTEHTKAVRA